MFNKTSFEKDSLRVLKGIKPKFLYFKPFISSCFIHNNGKDNVSKFDAHSDKAIFLDYACDSSVYNLRNKVVKESTHVIFDEKDNGILSEGFAI